MARVTHFEIAADDPKRAGDFYTAVFGWEIKKWDGPQEYWLVTTGPKEELGIDGGIMKRNKPVSEGGDNAFVNTISVASIDETIEAITNHGGKMTTGKTDIPGVGTYAYAKDTEGNVFGVMQSSQTGKMEA